jgi:hypothetical protein
VTLPGLLQYLQDILGTQRPVSERLLALSQRMATRCPDAANLAPLVVRLYDPCVEERWVLDLWPSTQLVLTMTTFSLGVPGILRRRLVFLLHQLRHEFPPHATTDRRRPGFIRTPFAAFHLSLWRAVQGGRAGAYILVAALIHARARALEHGMVQGATPVGSTLEQNIYRYLRSGRVLCLYGPRIHQLTVPLRQELIHAIAHSA